MKQFIIPIVVVLLTFTVVACTQNKASEMQVDKNLVAVRLDSVKSEMTAKPVRTSGLLSSETESTLSFKTGGIIQKTYVKTGDAVKKGQLLATLNLTEIKAQVVQAKNGLAKAGRDLKRIEQLLQDSAATVEQHQNITTLYENARETYRIASYNLTNSEIRAAFDGVVLKKWTNEGEMIGAGSPVFSLSARRHSAWLIKAGLSDRDWARITTGDSALVQFDHLSHPLTGRVVRIAQGADPMNGTYQAELEIEAGAQVLLANGMVGSLEIFPSQVDRLQIIPIESIVEGNGDDAFVYLPLKDNTVRKHPVKVVYFSEGSVAISSGLENIPLVVSAGSAYLNEESTIVVMK